MAKRKTLQQMEDEFFTEFDRPEVRELIVGLGGIDPCKKGSYIGGVIGGGTGPQGEPGPMGPQGPKGEQGDPMTFDSLTDAQKEALRGPKGDKGDPMTFNDLTDAQKEALRGPKGDKGDPMTFDSLTDAQKAALKGATGATGPQGPKGDTGPQGPQGVQGPKGDKGDKGDQGESEPLPPSDGKIYVMKDQAWTQLNFELVTGEAGAGAGTVTVRPMFEMQKIGSTSGLGQNYGAFYIEHEGQGRFFFFADRNFVLAMSEDGVNFYSKCQVYNTNNAYAPPHVVQEVTCFKDKIYTYNGIFFKNVFSDTVSKESIYHEGELVKGNVVAASNRYVVYMSDDRASGKIRIIEPDVSDNTVCQTRTGLHAWYIAYSPELDVFAGISYNDGNILSTVLNGADLSVKTSTWSISGTHNRPCNITWHPGLMCFISFMTNDPWVSSDGLNWVQTGSSLPNINESNYGYSTYAKELGLFFVSGSSNAKAYATTDLKYWTPITSPNTLNAYRLVWGGIQRRLLAYRYNYQTYHIDF